MAYGNEKLNIPVQERISVQCVARFTHFRGVQYSILDRTGPFRSGPRSWPFRYSVFGPVPVDRTGFFLGGHVGTVVPNDTVRPCQISAHPTSTGCLPMPNKIGGTVVPDDTSQPCHVSAFFSCSLAQIRSGPRSMPLPEFGLRFRPVRSGPILDRFTALMCFIS